MNAIIPLNVTALRVNLNDNSNIVGQFAGPMASFNQMPYLGNPYSASTGNTIYRSLNQPTSQSLGAGVHVHWELPDYFRRGVQPNTGGQIVFPQVPNRWMVVRYFSAWNSLNNNFDPLQTKAWVVVSDAVTKQLDAEHYPNSVTIYRPRITVPLPVNPDPSNPPYRFLGKVVDYDQWDPNDKSGDYLSNYQDENGNPYYLTSVGFVGPSFAAYYPECSSVFGFWDHFADLPAIYAAIQSNAALKFKVSYQVIGWIDNAAADPLQTAPGFVDPVSKKPPVTFIQAVQNQYASVLQQYVSRGADLKDLPNPANVFNQLASQAYKWSFPEDSLVYTTDPNTHQITSIDGPARTLCNGLMQEIVWDLKSTGLQQAFLSTPSGGAVWTDDPVKVAVGNTPTEALSALLKVDSGQNTDPQDLSNIEYLLDALQLGLLRDLEQNPNPLFDLDEALHSRAFGRASGGNLWLIKARQQSDSPSTTLDEVNLPLDLARKLHALNQAQKDYDQGRAELGTRRRQLFMDWFRCVNMASSTDNFYLNDLPNFIDQSGACELQTVLDAGTRTGILQYQIDTSTGQISAPLKPAGGDSKALTVWNTYQAVITALTEFPDFELRCVPAPNFWTPTEPVVLVEGKRVESARRNGPGPFTQVRVTPQLISTLQINSFVVNAAALAPWLNIKPGQPLAADAAALLAEASFLMPALATAVANALQAQGGANNPASGNIPAFVAALNSAQGNWSDGLFSVVHDKNYQAVKNPKASSGDGVSPALALVFTNPANAGWLPDPVAWNAQNCYPEFSPTRLDPYIPVFLVWGVTLDPLKRNNVPPPDPSCKPVGGSKSPGNYQAPPTYNAANLTQYFSLDTEAIENQYQLGTPFTTGKPVLYSGSAVLSRKATMSLVDQINRYIQDNPDDTKTNKQLTQLAELYQNRKMLAQALDGFNSQQILRSMLPRVPVQNLIEPPGSDTVTDDVQSAATASKTDNWYNFGFNNEQPIPGDLALANFGPLRAGFMEVMNLLFVDVFGQPMQMRTDPIHSDNSLELIPSARLQPESGDTANAGKVYLPPRLLMPTRLWFRWLAAACSANGKDMVEMNTHPAISPICGWVLPNHLDLSLMFYNSDGSPIGSFNLEHDASVYRTRPGNSLNRTTDPTPDIGPQGSPKAGIDPHTANLMWYVYNKGKSGGGFLKDLMYTIENSDQFIHTANYKQAAGLAVLVGRPLAISRAVLSIETSGGTVPLNQGDTSTCDPFHQDVTNKRYDYKTREQFSSGNITGVQFPLRLGELANVDDGLVGFLLEDSNGAYQNGILYSAAAPAKGNNGIVLPTATTIQLQPNGDAQVVTMLLDPRCAVHATTGILPVEELGIPSDQYAETMRNLAITFFTHPVLEEASGLVIPLPEEAGYEWSWIELDGDTATVSPPLKTQAANQDAHASYSPQTVLEGWLGLSVRPPKKEENS